jgi:integrase
LPYAKETPWDAQAPSKKDVSAAASKRRPFTPAESKKLLDAAQAGSALGDTIRVALLTGVRLEEVASLEASQVDPEARYYVIREGKSENAARVVPLVGAAHEVVKRRLAKVNRSGPLFPEVPVRKSTGRRGGALSQAFTRLRRKVLGAQTDRELAQHCFRHTWRTAARRAGVDLRTSHEMGGWSRGKDTDLPYDHGLEAKQYMRDQKKVEAWLRKQGYIG